MEPVNYGPASGKKRWQYLKQMQGLDRRGSRSRLKQKFPNAVKTPYWYLKSRHADLEATWNLVFGVRKFLSDRLTLQQAIDEIQKALETREERFLDLTRTRIYENPGSPYLKLLKFAGCELSDLKACVQRHGVEGALKQLAREGVYLTSDEFKGKQAVVRGTQSFWISPKEFEDPRFAPGYFMESSGTRNRPVPSFITLDWLAVRTLAIAVFFSAHELFTHTHATVTAILPGSSGINNLLMYAKLGVRTERWFATKIHVRRRVNEIYHYLTTHLIVLTGKIYGPGLPRPEFIDYSDADRIVRWVMENNRAGKACCITASASNAARIARAAKTMGVSLDGTKFIVHGEPFTV